jgi:hypothetical protein
MNAIPLCPPSYLPPTKEWRAEVREDFTHLQEYLLKLSASMVGAKGPLGASARVPLPPMKDRSAWIEFCLGDVIGGRGVQNIGTGADAKASLLLQMDQVMVRRVLGHLMSYVPVKGWSESKAATDDADDEDDYDIYTENDDDADGSASSGGGDKQTRANRTAPTFTSQHAAWLYSLSARLESPLHSETCAELRDGVRTLCKLRASLAITASSRSGCGEDGLPAADVLPSINTVIEVWGRVFGQAGEVEIDNR